MLFGISRAPRDIANLGVAIPDVATEEEDTTIVQPYEDTPAATNSKQLHHTCISQVDLDMLDITRFAIADIKTYFQKNPLAMNELLQIKSNREQQERDEVELKRKSGGQVKQISEPKELEEEFQRVKRTQRRNSA